VASVRLDAVLYGYITLVELHEFACKQLGSPEVTIDFSRNIIQSLDCPHCGESTDVFKCVGAVTEEQGKCPSDETMRKVNLIYGFTGEENYGNMSIAALGLPSYDVFVARSKEREMQILIQGDETAVLGAFSAD